MVIYCDADGNIYDVGQNRTGVELQRIEITDEYNPFADWSDAKICAYRCRVVDNRVVMMTPRVDSRLIEHIDRLDRMAKAGTAEVEDATCQLSEDVETRLAEIEDALCELSEV